MAFYFVSSLSGENFQTTQIMSTTPNEVYTEGEALIMTAGKLTKCPATTKPTFIAAKSYTAPATGNLDLPVYPIMAHHIYETTFAADGTAVTEGALVTIHTDGAQITGTTAAGVVTVVDKLGTGAVGTMARVRFV